MDNIALAAGWSGGNMDEEQCISILGQTLEDYNAVVRSRRFWVSMVTGGSQLRILNHDGSLDASFPLTRGIRGSLGAYALYELSGRSVFLDVQSQSHPLSYTGERIALENDGPVTLADLVSESDKERLASVARNHAGQVEVFFHAPTGGQLAALALRGGVGYLENYGRNDSINRRIHRRNLRICEHVAQVYHSYIDHYREDVSECNSEAEIRRLGPPNRVYLFPRPAGATDNQAVELARANVEYSDLPAWIEINELLADIADRHPDGSMFFRVKFQLNEQPWQAASSQSGASSAYVGTRAEYNLDIGTDGLLTQSGRIAVAETTIGRDGAGGRMPVGGGVGHEVNLETGETKTSVKASIGNYGVEIDDNGGRKVTGPYNISSEFNTWTAEGGAGVTLPLGPLGSIYMGLHFQGLREETVLAFTSMAPGLFDSMPVSELMSPRTLWADLTRYEIARLITIGFEEPFWNNKHEHPLDDFPEACQTPGPELEPRHRVAAVQLRIGLVGWSAAWRQVARPSPPPSDHRPALGTAPESDA
jgi:hypothetical protein